MCDDMGFSDLGSYGGEIKTPNIDVLATQGIRFSQFKNTGRCCPSRAALLTGRNQFAAEMGWMTAVDEHREAYRGQLSATIPTIAEILKDNNYYTYLSGKWHLTLDDSYKLGAVKPNGSWPFERGFNESYAGLPGGGSYYKVNGLVKNETVIKDFPANYYYTDAITENAVGFIKKHNTEKPMFLYLAHYAPHRPLEAPKDRIDKCRERYQVGYDVLRAQRYENLKKKGLISTLEGLPIHEREYHNKRPSWVSLPKKKKEEWITEMATYAAMIEIMDDGIGEVIKATKEKGIYENTVFLFLSDNGATKEGGDISQLTADLSNTPYRDYKISTYMGGTSSPLIIHYPEKFAKYKGEIRTDLTHITDILPTCLDIAGIEYPTSFHQKKIPQFEGKSLITVLEKNKLEKRDLFFQHEQSCAIISDNWKLVRGNISEPWELINLTKDSFEQYNVAANFPKKVLELEKKWNIWAKENNVLPIEKRAWSARIKHYNGLNTDKSKIN
ncbi:sulfatase-like hydrolase/transferase [Polaribacter sp. IC073]|nr:sulfatase-like hydrolase/transferase [Polaribacter sp. IC073]